VRSSRRSSRWAKRALIPIGIAAALVLAGCSQQELSGYLPTGQEFGDGPVTNHTETIMGLWNTSWIVLLGVGVITWGLILWAAIVYRRRRGQTGLPAQLRYNMPVEVAYTVIPFILIIGFFAFTARDQTDIETPHDPDVKILAFGKQWSWDFNYVNEDVHEPAGVQATVLANGDIDGEHVPTLWLPVGKQIEIDLQSRDVIHSFWVVDFLYKKDMIPGHPNSMYFIPEKIGEYSGKCAELCGEYHSQMLFKVKVVSEADYEAHIAELEADGFGGQLGADLNRNQNFPATGTQPAES